MDWTIWSNCNSAEVSIIYELIFMDMLAGVAVEKFIVSKLLPPFSFEVFQRATRLYSGCESLYWACHVNGCKLYALSFHSTTDQVIESLVLISQGALSGAILVFKFFDVSAVIVVIVALFFTVSLLVELWFDHDGRELQRAVSS